MNPAWRAPQCAAPIASIPAASAAVPVPAGRPAQSAAVFCPGDRKSTRLNSSHGYISYAVFCLKKKKKDHSSSTPPNTVHVQDTNLLLVLSVHVVSHIHLYVI